MDLQRLTEIEEPVAANSPDCPHPPFKDLVFDNSSIFFNGSTPLLLACCANELGSVKRIVKFWGVDVNQAAAYYFHPYDTYIQGVSKIDKATPLFVAASMGNLDIVRYLVSEAGADVSAKTADVADANYDGLSPLYGAVWEKSSLLPVPGVKDYEKRIAISREKRSAIVRFLLKSGANPSVDSIRPSDGDPMWLRVFCDGDNIIALVEYGMSVNHRYPNLKEIPLLNHELKRNRWPSSSFSGQRC